MPKVNLCSRLACELVAVIVGAEVVVRHYHLRRFVYGQGDWYSFTLAIVCLAAFVLGAIGAYKGSRFFGLAAMVVAVAILLGPV